MRKGIKTGGNDFYDDGRVIAPMGDLQRPNTFSLLPPRTIEKRRIREKAAVYSTQKYVATHDAADRLTKKELRSVAGAIGLAYLSAGLVFVAIFLGILLFCQYVWFR